MSVHNVPGIVQRFVVFIEIMEHTYFSRENLRRCFDWFYAKVLQSVLGKINIFNHLSRSLSVKGGV